MTNSPPPAPRKYDIERTRCNDENEVRCILEKGFEPKILLKDFQLSELFPDSSPGIYFSTDYWYTYVQSPDICFCTDSRYVFMYRLEVCIYVQTRGILIYRLQVYEYVYTYGILKYRLQVYLYSDFKYAYIQTLYILMYRLQIYLCTDSRYTHVQTSYKKNCTTAFSMYKRPNTVK